MYTLLELIARHQDQNWCPLSCPVWATGVRDQTTNTAISEPSWTATHSQGWHIQKKQPFTVTSTHTVQACSNQLTCISVDCGRKPIGHVLFNKQIPTAESKKQWLLLTSYCSTHYIVHPKSDVLYFISKLVLFLFAQSYTHLSAAQHKVLNIDFFSTENSPPQIYYSGIHLHFYNTWFKKVSASY